MRYLKSTYAADGSTAILAVNDEGEPHEWVTVCLAGYDMFPPNANYIFIPIYKISTEDFEMFKKDLVKDIICEVHIGYGKGLLAELRDDWEHICIDGTNSSPDQ